MKKGLITGSSSGIGLAIAERLLKENPDLELVGLSRRPGPLVHERFTHWESDLGDLETAAARARRFRQEFGGCDLVVCAAGRGAFRPSDAWSAKELDEFVRLNLTSPMLLLSELLPSLRQGAWGALVVLLSSTSARERAPVGAAYAATKGGLGRYAESLFMENRKQGIRVMDLCPGMTQTPFYEGERFAPAEGPETALSSESLAELVNFFFSGPGRTMNPTQLVLEPQKVGVVKRTPKPSDRDWL